MKKRVVHVLYSGLGGHGSVFFSLVKGDIEKEYDTRAIFCGIEPARPEYIDQCRQYGVPFHTVLKKRGFDLNVYRSLFNIFREIRPSVIVLHTAGFIAPALLYRGLNRGVKIMVRDTQAHHLKTKMEWNWLKWAVTGADRLIFLTPESRDGVIDKFGKKDVERKSVIIPNAIDTNHYTFKEPKALKNTVYLGMQSRLQNIKDHPTLLKSFALLKKQEHSDRFFLRIAGDGETMNSLKQAAKDLNISHSVEFCGMLNEPELLGYMHSLDIYVHATFGETMSNSIMQAMSCGLPVIASNVWGVNNMIEDGTTGLLYPSQDVNALHVLLERLIADEDLRHKLAVNERRKAERDYSISRLFNDYASLYKLAPDR